MSVILGITGFPDALIHLRIPSRELLSLCWWPVPFAALADCRPTSTSLSLDHSWKWNILVPQISLALGIVLLTILSHWDQQRTPLDEKSILYRPHPLTVAISCKFSPTFDYHILHVVLFPVALFYPLMNDVPVSNYAASVKYCVYNCKDLRVLFLLRNNITLLLEFTVVGNETCLLTTWESGKCLKTVR